MDALEPSVIGDLIRSAVLTYRDDDLYEVMVEQEKEQKRVLESAERRWSEIEKFLSKK